MPNDKLIQQEKAAKLKKEMIGKKYKHFKGSIYQVDTIAIHSETNELRVIYHSVDNPDLVWDRNLDMFLSPVDTNKYPDVKQELRFEPYKTSDEDLDEKPAIIITHHAIHKADITFAIKDKNGLYYAGYNQWNEQVRKAKLYHSEKMANEICTDERYLDRKPFLTKVCTMEVN